MEKKKEATTRGSWLPDVLVLIVLFFIFPVVLTMVWLVPLYIMLAFSLTTGDIAVVYGSLLLLSLAGGYYMIKEKKEPELLTKAVVDGARREAKQKKVVLEGMRKY